ncbi:MAG: class I SAM-dependent methyltransferase [Candidatus Dormibacteraeota bacterium]|uniref:Class I SAM-dependent methyltransferase n=1 Tax=Candidatus Amunia macphersoniae TaxID=3127014 RepID=A0A934NIJ0_9BACT|nr:class I SAM-dependent methyltransferase [Candidatus Dormibacteraeota bacterium]
MLTVDFARLRLQAGARVLDIGCGNGRHAFEALRRGAQVVATDLDDAALVEVERMAAAMALACEVPAGAGLRTVRADARHLPFDEAEFDVVIAAEVLEHIDEDAVAIAELCRVLRPGGMLAVTVPRWWPEKVCWALSREYHEVPGGHVRIYRRGELMERLRLSGLVVGTTHHHAHALHSPYWWLRCALGMSREQAWAARLYHRFLVYDLTQRPRWTRRLEGMLNPVLGKSVVIYARRPRSLVTGDA